MKGQIKPKQFKNTRADLKHDFSVLYIVLFITLRRYSSRILESCMCCGWKLAIIRNQSAGKSLPGNKSLKAAEKAVRGQIGDKFQMNCSDYAACVKTDPHLPGLD